MENYIVINGKKIELTTEQLKTLGIEVRKPNPFEIPKSTAGVDVYSISDMGTIYINHSPSLELCKCLLDAGNFCTDEKLTWQRSYNEFLNRLLWRYSIEHALDRIGHVKLQFYVYYDHISEKWEVAHAPGSERYYPGFVFFDDEDVARNAIKEVVEPFMKAHPRFRLQ